MTTLWLLQLLHDRACFGMCLLSTVGVISLCILCPLATKDVVDFLTVAPGARCDLTGGKLVQVLDGNLSLAAFV